MAAKVSRRGLLKAGLIGVPVAGVTVVGGGFGALWATTQVDTVGRVAFRRPLAIPPLAESELDGEGRRVFRLAARAGTSELLPGTRSRTWGYNGSYLGPTLRAARGERVRINVRNQLDVVTTVHWHGMHLPARFDGGPHQQIAPGETWSPSWRIDQQAATLWYHPHPHRRTRRHVGKGLAGMFILDDPDSSAERALPNEYGVDDIPVIIQDRNFDDSGEMDADTNFGDTLLVNGIHGPFLDVTTEAVRLRILNASAARVYNVGVSDDREFVVVGSDGGLLPTPVRRRRILLSPGERAEVVVRMRPGETVVLRSYEPDLGQDWFSGMFEGARDRFDVLQLRAADHLARSPSLPDTLAPAPDLADGRGRRADRTFEMRGRTINDRSMDMSRIDEVVEVGATEIWEVSNADGKYHNFHVHDVQFQVVYIGGKPPPPELAGWKDTIFLPPGSAARLAMRFRDYTDPDLPYMYHCHRLRHEDRGMMGQFVVVEPGQPAGTPPVHRNDSNDHAGARSAPRHPRRP